MGTSIEVLAAVATGLGEAFAASTADGHLLYGFAEHVVDTVYLASSTGLRRRGRFGLLFIDGDHSEDGVRSDFESWAPMLAANGVVAFHSWPMKSSGVNGEASSSALMAR